MKYSVSFLILFFVMVQSAFAGVGGGGTVGGSMLSLTSQENMDLVQTLKVDANGMVKFRYKAFDKQNVEIQMVQTRDLNDAYREALRNSLKTKKWTSVIVE